MLPTWLEELTRIQLMDGMRVNWDSLIFILSLLPRNLKIVVYLEYPQLNISDMLSRIERNGK